MGAVQSGVSDQFDDLISDPEGASEGNVEETGQPQDVNEGEKPGKVDENLETFDNLDSQVNNLEPQEEKKEEDEEDDKKEDEEEGKEDKPEDEKEDSGEKKETPEEEKKEEGEEKPKGKTIKAFQDNKKIEIPQDAMLKVKVDGKWEKVSVGDLRDNYSGQKAWDEKFSEVNEKEKTLTAKERELQEVQGYIKNQMTEVKDSVSQALQDNGNPMDAMSKMIDLLGVDSYDFNKALFDHMSEELVTLNQMDEYEQKAYWLEKRNEHLSKKHETFESNLKQTQAQEERIAQIDQMRQAHGVSESDFVSAFNELSNNGEHEVETQKVMEWAASKPFIIDSEELLTPYEDQLSDDELDQMTAKVANAMKVQGFTKEEMTTWLAEYYEVEDLVDSVNNKTKKFEAGKRDQSNDQSVPTNQTDIYKNASYESFDDFE